MSPGGSFPPFGMKNSKLAESKVAGMGSKIFAGGSLGVIVSRVSPISTL